MRHVSQGISIGLLLVAALYAHAQTRLIEDLDGEFGAHDMAWQASEAAWEAQLPPRLRPGKYREPGPDAPAELLADWWSSETLRHPAAEVCGRLLELVAREPERVPDLLRHLPDTPAAHDVLKRLLDQAERVGDRDKEWIRAVRAWLVHHSRYFRDALQAAAAAVVFDGTKVDGAPAITALSRVDWPRAAPLVRQLAARSELPLVALALGLLLEHDAGSLEPGAAMSVRAALRAIVSNATAPQAARDLAFRALDAHAHLEHDAWFLGCVGDSDLTGSLIVSVQASPRRWIPALAVLLRHPHGATREAAARILVSFAREWSRDETALMEVRSDALRPLLPGLSAPDPWPAELRERVGRAMDQVDLTDCAPDLIAWLEGASETQLWLAARALARCPTSQAIPALRAALERAGDNWERSGAVIDALIACGGVGDPEARSALRAFACRSEGVIANAESLLGEKLARRGIVAPAVLDGLVEDAAVLETTSVEAARKLRDIVHATPGRARWRHLASLIISGRATRDDVLAAIGHRKSVSQEAADLLRPGLLGTGLPRGFAAALLGDQAARDAVLAGDDSEAQRALLTAARIGGDALPLDALRGLLATAPPLVVQAIARYLEDDSGEDTLRLLRAHRPGAYRIRGPLHIWDVHQLWNRRLKAEMSAADRPDEMFCLVGRARRWHNGQVVVRVRGERATVQWVDYPLESAEGGVTMYGTDSPLYQTRELAADEVSTLREFLASHDIDRLPSVYAYDWNGTDYMFWHLGPDGGRRLSMDNPGWHERFGSRYDLLYRRLRGLIRHPGMTTRSHVQDRVPGAEVLVSDRAKYVVRVGRSAEALVWDRKTGEYSWCPIGPEGVRWSSARPARRRTRELVATRQGGEDGLWLRDGSAARLVAPGAWRQVSETADQKWAVVAKPYTKHDQPIVARVEVATRAVTGVELPRPEEISPGAEVAPGLLVLTRARDEKRAPDAETLPECYLLDAATGVLRPLGVKASAWLTGLRELPQRASEHEVWLFRYDRDSFAAQLACYDWRRDVVTPRATIAGLSWDEHVPRVDDDASAVYAAVGGWLVKLPLGPAPTPGDVPRPR